MLSVIVALGRRVSFGVALSIHVHAQKARSTSCSDTASTGNLHQFVGRPFHRSQVLSVFMVLNQLVSLGVAQPHVALHKGALKLGTWILVRLKAEHH